MTPPFFRARAPALARGALLAREHVPSAGHPSLPRHPLAAAPPGCYAAGWPVLYSEGITAFDKVRGFDMVVCAEPAAYKTISAACGDVLDYEETHIKR